MDDNQLNKEIVVKTINKNFDSKIKSGIVWFELINVINNLKLAKRDIELLSFTNYRGTISSTSAKEEFCKLFGSSTGTITNIVSKKLIPLKLLVKDKGKLKINESLKVDFSNDLMIRLTVKTFVNEN